LSRSTRVRALPDLRRRPERRGAGRQCRLARQARIYPLSARDRPAFLDQPDAELRQRQAPPRPRTVAVVLGIQLHDLQGYDFLELSRRAACRLQLGGSDQWGNIVNGIELARRVDGTQVYGLTTPLLTTADGGKMGKTERGAVWLNADQLPPYDYWQFWRNAQDADVGRFLRLFTDVPLDEIARLEALEGAEINEAKKLLADLATGMAHGDDAAREAADTARRTFEEGAGGEALPTLKVEGDGLSIVQALTVLGFAASNGEARRKIGEGAVRLNNVVISDPSFTIVLESEQPLRISLGKKRHGLLTR
jgi:tyrosyl-tRNA synthetase